MIDDTNTSSNSFSKKSLDDLFGFARSENVPEVISRMEVNAIVSPEYSAHSVPLTEKLAGFVQQHLISTPFRTGATLMTSSILITAAILAGTGYFVSTQPTQHQTTASVSSSPQAQHSQVFAPATPRTATQLTARAVTRESLPELAAPRVYHDEPVKDSLTPVDLSPDQLSRLGIELSNDGAITFYRSKGDGSNKGMRVSLSPEGGTMVSAGVDLPKNDVAVGVAPPRLVTDRGGIRRYSTILMPNKNGYAFASVIRDSSHGKKGVSVFSSEVNTMSGDSTKKVIMINTSSTITDSAVHGMLSQPEIAAQMRSMLHNGNGFNTIIEGDSTRTKHFVLRRIVKHQDNRNGIIEETSSDSEMNLAGLPREINADSIAKAVGINGLPGTPHKMLIKKFIQEDNEVNIGSNRKPTLLPGANSADINSMIDGAIREVTVNTTNFSNMIPVRVRNLNNPAKPNEVIFWYDSIPELTNLLPITKAGVNMKSSGITLSVYPNPTTGPATIHYSLKKASDAHFALHNLLGQKIMNIGDIHGQQGDESMDLSNLEAGVYLLITTTDSGDRNVERVVVTK